MLKTRARDINELAEGAAFLFKTRPLELTDKAAELLMTRRSSASGADFRASCAGNGLDNRGSGSQSEGIWRRSWGWASASSRSRCARR